eukprot:CAMPEP_0113606276 /NCGR_PEP_ID=MMETSP0017_2-20120614/2769_1 /TAXON_ID=2856 /ORGANISM="Cylindrotheca closterium" /LENGTH=1216 /DNA_ID=CAMNT_0000514811 /DNA_START=270 /DNA_END=3920 /DNA_ORIENTATION=- /assembly_acc=CAM_ASM_000147
MSPMNTEDFDWFSEKEDACPCRRPYRWLEEEQAEKDDDSILLWEIIYTCVVLFAMFAALISDRYGADSVMLTALTAFMAARTITVEEGLDGFSNEGLMSVLTLFVVADGISKTGALDWYMGKLLGRPATAASAQLKLMIPIAVVSAFLNNTPVVAVMIPIVQRWAKNIRISAQQLLIPLSFASILGGTCTLIGTSTNLVVAELLVKRYPNDLSASIGLFDLGYYGVPVALAGICYILVASPCLLPGGSSSSNRGSTMPLDSQEEILLGARLTPWSPAAGRSVKRSGLRDTGGIYLVSVHRAATGNIHRAVGQDFVLNVGDILYFTGLVEGFGEFCEEHGMEVLTSDIQADNKRRSSFISIDTTKSGHKRKLSTSVIPNIGGNSPQLHVVAEDAADLGGIPVEVGVSAKSLMQADEAERKQSITRMIDTIRGVERDEPTAEEQVFLEKVGSSRQFTRKGPHKVVVTSENDLVVIGVDANDRPGLLLDISKGLLRLNLSFRHTEASVVHLRSISIWRCEHLESQIPDLEEIWSVLNALLENDGNQAVKKRGLRVIRAAVTKSSSLIGKKVFEVDFRNVYRAAIVAVQKGGRNVAVSSVVFQRGDVIVLQANDDSPLLKPPPRDFYTRPSESNKQSERQGITPVSSLLSMVTKTIGSSSSQQKLRRGTSGDLESQKSGTEAREVEGEGEDSFFFADLAPDSSINDSHRSEIVDMTNSINAIEQEERIWNDLQVLIMDEENREDNANSREFLTAMEVAPKSGLAGRTVTEIGLDKLSGVFLVSIDRPMPQSERDVATNQVLASIAEASDGKSDADDTSISIQSIEPGVTAISTGTPLMEGDVLWFAGSASSLGDLRKIPGLISYESEEVEKMNEKIHDRRLVEAVVARRGPLVGKSVKSIRFRTRYGAAVIAVHRDGNRVQEHPGKIKLQAGDVLLLEAGPTFIKKSMDQDRSFALLAEVKDSAPPRLRLLIPALTIAVAMLAVFTADIGTSLFVCALVASILMVALGILSEQEARDAVNWEVYITIASAFGIGKALVNSGVAASIANFLVDVGNAIGIGDAGLLGAVYFATFLISNVVTNNAAAALLFPIALDAADQTGVDRIIMSYCLMLGASASFMSPFGYTTNLLIYGPGGYKYKDFLVIGTPMQLVLWILSIILLSSMNDRTWWMYWAGMFLLLMFIVLTRMANLSRILPRRRSSLGEPKTRSSLRSTEDEVMAA